MSNRSKIKTNWLKFKSNVSKNTLDRSEAQQLKRNLELVRIEPLRERITFVRFCWVVSDLVAGREDESLMSH